jgi:hypothetical protein
MLGAGHDTGRIFRNCTDFVNAKTPRARRPIKPFLFGFFALLASLRLQSCVGQALQPRNGMQLKIAVGGPSGTETGRSAAGAEYRSADADHSRALGDGDLEVVAHTH